MTYRISCDPVILYVCCMYTHVCLLAQLCAVNMELRNDTSYYNTAEAVGLGWIRLTFPWGAGSCSGGFDLLCRGNWRLYLPKPGFCLPSCDGWHMVNTADVDIEEETWRSSSPCRSTDLLLLLLLVIPLDEGSLLGCFNVIAHFLCSCATVLKLHEDELSTRLEQWQ